MKILVFGAGVIGITYAWQLSEAGQDVALLVRQGRKQALEDKGIAIASLDVRKKPAKPIKTIYHPHVVEDFSPSDGYALILVCVKRNQLGEALPQLAAKAGDATILFLQNNWSGRAEIEHSLAPTRYLLGFPFTGEGRDAQGINSVLASGTMLGEPDGRMTPRLTSPACAVHAGKDVMGLLVNHRLTTVLASIVAGFIISLNIFLDCTRPSLEVVSHVPADNTGRSHFLCPSRRITSRRVGSSDSGASGTSRCHAKVTLLHIMEHHAPTTIQSECEVFRQCGSSHYGTNQLPTAAVGACRDACG